MFLGRNGLEGGVDVAIAVGESDSSSIFTSQTGYMVGHEHVFVVDFFVDLDGLEHVDIAFIREYFDEIEESTFDVAEVDVENFISLTEVTNYVVDFFTRIFEHF